MTRPDLTVPIAGGIGGITTAPELGQRGIRALLSEQAEAFREVGAGIQVSADATRVLRSLGLLDDMATIGRSVRLRRPRTAWMQGLSRRGGALPDGRPGRDRPAEPPPPRCPHG